jgi:hypothetical protein
MARQGGRAELEQSDMRLALNLAKMAQEGFSRTAIEETKYFIKKPRAEVRGEMKRGLEFPVPTKVKAAIQRQPAMLPQNQTSGCLPCQNGTAKNPQTCWRYKGTGAPPPARRRKWISEPTAPSTRTPPTPTGNTSGTQLAEIVNFPAGYSYSDIVVLCVESFEDDEATEHATEFDPDMLTDEGWYTLCGVVMQLTFILKTRSAD